MSDTRPLVEILHGVNLSMLGERDPAIYGTFTLGELEVQIERYGHELGLRTSFFATNHEGEYVERLHSLRGAADGLILNPGAWTHYSWAIRDALEIAALPAVEVHIGDPKSREEWRRLSVIEELCIATVSGQGMEGYRQALVRLRDELGG